MNWGDAIAAFKDAERTIAASDSIVSDMARMVAGRLRRGNVSAYYLKQLKRELQDFDMRTGEWNDA